MIFKSEEISVNDSANCVADNRVAGEDSGPSDRGITELLNRWQQGERAALNELIPLVYDELRHIASRYLRTQPTKFTLQSTALVHEAYIRMAAKEKLQMRDRAHFFGVAAHVIRGILVDHVRSRNAVKRGRGASVTLDERLIGEAPRNIDLLVLDQALTELELLDPHQSKIVEMRYFAGFSIDETAECLNISSSTVKREWVLAKAWIQRKLC